MIKTHLQNRRLGYARVSTYGQTLDVQLEQLRRAGCIKIYREKVTGAHSDRRELLKMLKGLAPGDVVTVTRIDRVARSAFDLFAIVKQIVDAKAQFRSLAEPWALVGSIAADRRRSFDHDPRILQAILERVPREDCVGAETGQGEPDQKGAGDRQIYLPP